jgi:hypothetical protein
VGTGTRGSSSEQRGAPASCRDRTDLLVLRYSSSGKEHAMALGLYFQPTGFSTAVYDEAVSQLEQAGAGFGQVPGRTFHCAMEVDGQVSVFDVWESKEQFEKFGETLVPIMSKLGANPGEPMIMAVHNVQNG